ncbi:18845_t:CDS:2 [Gigaspora margarita]|uniref:18845_t:CDS:1 n=1 Tax=Gigaspora margarita TaxID=4874 RepID=A0ABM8W2D0_GIGMA|nr:18845_t:CDS:2 [Gigaspora margarita]
MVIAYILMKTYDVQTSTSKLLESKNSMNDTSQTEYTDINPSFKEEFDELLQINVEKISMDMDMNDELSIEKFFNIRTFEQNQEEIVKRSLDTYSQRHITSIDEDWSVDNIFSYFRIKLLKK